MGTQQSPCPSFLSIKGLLMSQVGKMTATEMPAPTAPSQPLQTKHGGATLSQSESVAVPPVQDRGHSDGLGDSPGGTELAGST